jgi:hypothetical protein
MTMFSQVQYRDRGMAWCWKQVREWKGGVDTNFFSRKRLSTLPRGGRWRMDEVLEIGYWTFQDRLWAGMIGSFRVK